MTLPYDIARCPGLSDESGWREGCERCLRRLSPGDPERQVMMEPPGMIVFWCEFLIEVSE
jgi:hypothetical protein